MQALDATAAGLPIFVDLDGTLVKTDVLFEAFISAFKRNPFVLLRTLWWLARGGVPLVKERLCAARDIGAAHLPYNAEVVAYLREAKTAGRRLVLATSAHHAVALQVATHFGFFDDIIATENGVNRSGESKLAEIRKRTGGSPFVYLGNARADLPIWKAASLAGIVGASDALAAQASSQGCVTFRLGKLQSSRAALWRAMRPHQWAKNLLIFIPLTSAHRLYDVPALATDGLVFFAFSLCASAVYLLNDLSDLSVDRRHHEKCNRPFAAGALSIPRGLAAAAVLGLLAFLLAAAASPPALGVLGAYALLSLCYSFAFKQVAMLDVVVLAGLYTLRIIAGFLAVDVPLSFWLLALSMFAFTSLALMKRCSELHNLRNVSVTTVAGRGYLTTDQEQLASFGSASGYISVLILALYINSAEVVKLYHQPEILWGVCPIVLFWISRCWLLARRGLMNEDPIIFALQDRPSYLCAVLCAACAVAATLL
jgi:4-hydroxybenzoate polyprenyltransferase